MQTNSECPLNALGAEINAINSENGWRVLTVNDWPNTASPQQYVETCLNEIKVLRLLAATAMIHSEASEATEAVRNNDRANFEEEIGDTIIRCLDVAHGLGIDIDRVVKAKLEKNKTRGFRHGGKAI